MKQTPRLVHAPQFDSETAASLARKLYGIDATAVPLPSERDQNFLLTLPEGARFVLKIANGQEDPQMLVAQQQALAHVAARGGRCPRVVPAPGGAAMHEVQAPGGGTHLAWLVTYLPGLPLGAVRRHGAALLADLGHSLGVVDRALADFDHPAIHRDFAWDLQNGVAVVRERLPLLADDDLRQPIAAFVERFAAETAPRLAGLRRGAIHNDANDYNVVVSSTLAAQTVSGLVDFGDMVHSLVVADLAVALAYALLDKRDLPGTAAAVVGGYHAAYPLLPAELAVLHDLVCLRLCVSACMAAAQQRVRPDDPYLRISQAPLRRTLPRLLALPRGLPTAVYRHACGLPPAETETAVVSWLRERNGRFAPVLAADLTAAPVIDL
ncbi:MAG: phosphotransferase, partial [Anaerolineales bacterium]|nr:phosphotransferase [Anaerolineales bacterium]